MASRFARGDGGFGGPSEGQPEPHKVPGSAPDKIVDITTRPDQALVYRLCGDRNPLHCDPEFAKKAGFPKPILHGMCTYGITCRGVLQTYADYDPSAFKQHVARFSSPVFPGETVTMELWKDGNVISFEAKVKSSNVDGDQERQDGAGLKFPSFRDAEGPDPESRDSGFALRAPE